MNDEKWLVSRRKFVETVLLGSIAVQFPWITSCSVEQHQLPESLSPLNRQQFLNLKALLGVLFPSDGNGPGADEINADTYVLWVLNDSQIDPGENKYIVKKLTEFSNLSLQIENEEFFELSSWNKNSIVKEALATSWGTRFFSRLLTLTFEALLVHPLYKVNANEVGWLWLNHNPGAPRATKNLAYPQILTKKNDV